MSAAGSTVIPVANDDTHCPFAFGPELSLLGTIICELTPLQEERSRMIDEENFDGVRRKVVEELRKAGQEPDPTWIEEGILALKQYYAVALLDPVNFHAVSDLIDPFWHAHILHTRQYMAFCEQVFGQYVHHTPLDHARPQDVQKVKELYAYSHWAYGQMFSSYSRDFFPPGLEDHRLVCFHHGNDSEELVAASSFPYLREMRIEAAV